MAGPPGPWRLRRDELHRRKKSTNTARVASEQRQMSDVGVRPDEKVRQGARLFAAAMPVFLECFARLKRCIQGQRQTGECGKPVLKLLLSLKLDRQFGEDDSIVTNRPFISPLFDLLTRPIKPVRIPSQNVCHNAGVHEDHPSPRVSRSQSAVRPLIFPPRRSNAKALRPGVSLPAFTTSTPSGWSTNSTSHLGNKPCRFRNSGGMVIWPLPVTFMTTFSLRKLVRVNQRHSSGSWGRQFQTSARICSALTPLPSSRSD